MSISCSCDMDDGDGTYIAGEPRIVTARKPRKCSDCGGEIHVSDVMYVQSFFDYSETRAVSPQYMCERCGDLICSLSEQGYCFTYGGVLEQWREYRHKIRNNAAKAGDRYVRRK